jgi:hypothetical protein
MCHERKIFKAFIEAEIIDSRRRVQDRENNHRSFLV